MTQKEFDALLMKMNQMFITGSSVMDFQPYGVYTVARKIIDMIEKQNTKKEPVRNFTIVKDD